jgi:hypothetical protein
MTVNPQLQRFINPRLLRGAGLCVQAATVKTIAESMPPQLKAQLTESADASIRAVIDDYCGTGTGGIPTPPKGGGVPSIPHGLPHELNPWSGPSPLGLELASVITVYANTRVQAGTFQAQLMEIAGLLVKRAYNVSNVAAAKA